MNILKKFKDFCLFYQNFDKTKEINKNISMRGETMRYSIRDKLNCSFNTLYSLELENEEVFNNIKNRLNEISSIKQVIKEKKIFTKDFTSWFCFSQLKDVTDNENMNYYYIISRMRQLNEKESIVKYISIEEDSHDRYDRELDFSIDKIDNSKNENSTFYTYDFNNLTLIKSFINSENKYLYYLSFSDSTFENIEDEKEKIKEINKMIEEINHSFHLKKNIKDYEKKYSTSIE